MNIVRNFKEDLIIARCLLKHDERVTRNYFYRQCYPLFKSIFDHYYTDCETVKEFIDEIYLLVLAPSKETGKCQLENYRGESSLASWIKTVCLFYCYKKYEKKNDIETLSSFPNFDDNTNVGDSILDKLGSCEIDLSRINRMDIEILIGMMPNDRFRRIIRLRYLENLTNEETAEALGMTMANYYNKHKLAKEQFIKMFKKEAYHG